MLLGPIAAWSLVGCYAYLPVASAPAGEPELAGRTVRVTLTAEGTRRVEPTLGAGVVEVEGVVDRATADSLWLAVRLVATGPRDRFASSGAQVTFPQADLAKVELQALSRRRSALLAAGVAAVMATIASVLSASAGGSGTGEPGPSPQPQRIPLR
ncbi:MAG: hypothetical protein RLZ32_1774 [Gemmatimonadota bacterium]|jgi:hypothetical protein